MDNENKLLLKDDINFLDSPNWVLNEKEKIKEYVINKETGFYKISTAADTLPNRFDKIILYYLLTELLKSNFNSSKIVTTRYKIASSVFYGTKNVGKNEYDRLMLSLKRWNDIALEFKGIFYDGDTHTTRYFHVIDDVILNEEKKELYIKFNDQYLQHLKVTEFCKYIDFDKYKKLTRPISARLYEILVKNFQDRYVWQIDVNKLAEKMTLSEIYPSHIIQKLKPAINEINNRTDVKLEFRYDEKSQICTFIKLAKEIKDNNHDDNSEELNDILNLLPSDLKVQKSLRGLLSEYLHKEGIEYVKSNIIYTLQNSRNNTKSYLKNCLKNDWGEELRAAKEAQLSINFEVQVKEEQKKTEEDAKEKAAQEQIKKYYAYFQSLPNLNSKEFCQI